ncbi:MAG: sugar ABC transporter substrate-binding protein [Lachnospiraceae bacterium]|nr:sugar ABC transporter substrate-binding protein [Lachnospiraceae bacterium]
MIKIAKRFLAFCGAGILSLSLCACTSGQAKNNGLDISSADSDVTIDLGPDLSGEDFSDYRVGVSLANCTLNTYNSSYVQALNEAMAEYEVNTTVFDAFGDTGQQAAQIATLISMDVDLILLWPANSDTAVTWVQSINEAGIPVVTVNTDVSSEGEQYIQGYVGPSGVDEAYHTASQMVEDLEGMGSVIGFFAQDNYAPVMERRQGLKSAIAGTNVNLIEEYTNCTEQSIAATYMAEFLKKHAIGEIDAVFCYDDECALGVLEAMDAADRSGEVKVYVAATGTYDSLSYIEDGMIAATAIQSPIVDARTAVNHSLNLLLGNSLPEFHTYISTPIITSDNVNSLNLTPWSS